MRKILDHLHAFLLKTLYRWKIPVFSGEASPCSQAGGHAKKK